MTAQETMQPGRELDAKIYEANGHTWFECWNYEDVYDDEIGEVVRYQPLEVLEKVPHYSTDIAAAWKLVEKAKLCICPPSEKYPFDVKLWCVFQDTEPFTEGQQYFFGDTAPHAICLAFLALSESEVKE